MAEGWYEAEESSWERWSGQTVPRALDWDWIQRYQAHWSVCFGSIGYGYGHRNLWKMEDDAGRRGILVAAALDAPGSRSLIHLRRLIESKPLTARVPDPRLIAPNSRGTDAGLAPNLRCATRDEAGRWAMVYSTRGEPFRAVLSRLAAGQAAAAWYNPRTGRWRAGEAETEAKAPFAEGIPCGPGAPDRYFHPPDAPADGNDWVLLLDVGEDGP
jgi:hypothetical protein